MIRAGFLLLAAVAFLASGCVYNEYEIELRPKGDAIERDLTAWSHRSTNAVDATESTDSAERIYEISRAELLDLADAYGQPIPTPIDKKHTFSGKFRGTMPRDLGGAGTYTRYESPLGSLFVYLERVRGSDDLVADLDARRAALNRIVDIIAGWLVDELKDDPVAPKLHALLDGPVRRDATNLLVDVWSTSAAHRNASLMSNNQAMSDLAARSIQYLIEHGYMTPDSAPRLTYAFADSSVRGKHTLLLECGRELAMKKLAVEDRAAFDRVLALLADTERTRTTFQRFVRSTPEYAAAVRLAEEKAKKTGASAEVSPDDVFIELVVRAAFPTEPFASGDRLRAKLHVAAEPFATNGKWDQAEKVVRWDDSIDPHDARRAGLPLQLFAAWAEPDEAGQSRQFGKVILSGAALAKYVFWYRCLVDDERKQWDALLASLRPGEDMQVKIRLFRFRADLIRERGDLAEVARDVLLPALREHEIR
jgi:hypothetical protein